MHLTNDLKHKVITGSASERHAIFDQCFLAFALYYFPDYFKHGLAPFHNDFADDLDNLSNGVDSEDVWVGFKESGKTTFAKMWIVYLIAFKKKHYINIDSADGKNAAELAFETALELQTNKRIINDFGQLFTEQRTDEEKKMKKVSSFITANDVKVEAFSTGQPTRGRLYKHWRPDCYILDDCENINTIQSVPMTQKIIAHVNELRSGRASNCAILYLGNYITDTGVVQFFMDTVNRSGNGKVRFIPVASNGKPNWPKKYCMTDAEALEINKALPREQWLTSLESKRRDLGGSVFDSEMMLNPMASGDLIFNRNRLTHLINVSKSENAEYEESAGFRFYEKFNPSHRYAIGADTAKGVGKDSSTTVLIDFSTVPCLQIGSFANNSISPDIFAHEIKRQAMMFGECLVAPESNAQSGGATINELKNIYAIDKIFRPRGRKTGVEAIAMPQPTLGFDTNVATKHEIIFQLKSAVEDGKLKILDPRILEEMKYYSRKEVQSNHANPLATRHFDLLIATAIAWAMREYAEVSKTKQAYVQLPPDLSEFEAPSVPVELQGQGVTITYPQGMKPAYQQAPYQRSEFE